MSKVYISGPITNTPDFEVNFQKRADELHEMGYTVCNPVLFNEILRKQLHREPTYQEYLKKDIAALVECDGISFLDGSENSVGSRLEREIADKCGIPIVEITRLSKKW